MDGIDAELVAAWLAARSIARGLPLPVAVAGGLRVDTATAEEEARYVFAAPCPAIGALGREIARPRVALKLCAPPAALAALLPPGWDVARTGWVMVRDAADTAPPAPLPAGFALHTASDAARATVAVHGPDGRLAASGHAAEHGGVFAYDRIRVDPGFRRQGLGRALMAALAATRRSPASREMLTATDMGRLLYETIGWRTVAPYSTALRPEPRSPGEHAAG